MTAPTFSRLSPLQWLARKPSSLALGLYCFLRQMALVAWESLAVVFFMKVLGHGLLDRKHPWVTGLDPSKPKENEPIWFQNIAYRSTSKLTNAESDEIIIGRVGRFLSKMVQRSARGESEIPHGPKRRMPHAVNYLHGGVHHNGLFMIFDDIPDLMAHVKDPTFRKEMLKLGRRQRREITLILRTRRVDPLQYAHAIGCLRGVLPWFSNGNGPTKKPVLWGNAAPYPVVNLINGAWMRDLWTLWRKGEHAVCRPALEPNLRIAPLTPRGRRYVSWSDRFSAWLMFMDVRARGFRGQLVFTNRRVIEPKRWLEYKKVGGYGRWVGCHNVPHPFQAKRTKESTTTNEDVSVIIPTLEEEERIESCILSVLAQWPNAQVIVADAHSTDRTAQRAEALGAQVVYCDKKGRGSQCRQGARHARAELLIFLHADSLVGEGAAKALAQFSEQPHPLAKFSMKFNERGFFYRCYNAAAPLNSYFTNFGDQGIVIRRAFYNAIGEMPDMPLFEDVELFWRSWLFGARLQVLKAPVYTSGRRFEREGVLKQMCKDTSLMIRYAMGAKVAPLVEHYGQAPRLLEMKAQTPRARL